MAIAKATCVCSTCGQKFEVRVKKANRRDADSFEKWAENNVTECNDCRHKRIKAEHDEKNLKAAQAAEKAGLPNLVGSEKQIRWATSIRQDAVSLLVEHKTEAAGRKAERKIEIYIEWLMTHIKASWWIDNRVWMKNPMYVPSDYIQEYQSWLDARRGDTVSSELKKAAEEEMIVAPVNARPGTVRITVTNGSVSAYYPKDDDFKAVVKDLGYVWEQGAWKKHITITTGTAAERAAELGNKLLATGFAVMIADPDIRQAAVDGMYEPEHRRWITCYTTGDYAGWLCIRLVYGENLYEKAKAIRGSRYNKPNIAVPASEYEAVEDFASCYGYRLSPGATEAISQARETVKIVTPATPKRVEYKEHRPEDILLSSAEVLDDLIDDQ